MKDPLLEHIASAMQLAVLQRLASDRFRWVGPVPEWLCELRAEKLDDEAESDPHSWFEYLNFFLEEEAERFWASSRADSLRSLAWVEVDRHGEDRTLEAIATLGSDGQATLILQQARMERAEILQQARQAALAQERFQLEQEQKQTLLHGIVHDLKNPLSVIGSSLSLIQDLGPLSPEQARLAEITLRQSDKQERFIAQILEVFSNELAALEAPSEKSERALDLHAAAQEACQAMENLFADRHVRLELESPAEDAEADWGVQAEKDGLERLLANLLENALRFAPRFSTVMVRLEQADSHTALEVLDEGPGVPAGEEERIFQKFVRSVDRPGAAGLGLFLARMSAERWGGQVGYRPRPEGGACFRLELKPFQP